jgi:hypothetical protein
MGPFLIDYRLVMIDYLVEPSNPLTVISTERSEWRNLLKNIRQQRIPNRLAFSSAGGH